MIDVYVNVKHSSLMRATATVPATAKPEMPDDRSWTIGELSTELQVTTRTLRFYEDQGLIAPVRRGATRIYRPRDRARLKLILRGKRFGMSLDEIGEIVGMYDGAALSERRQLTTLLGRLAEISDDLRERQRDLARTLDEIADVSDQCRQRIEQLDPATPSQGQAPTPATHGIDDQGAHRDGQAEATDSTGSAVPRRRN